MQRLELEIQRASFEAQALMESATSQIDVLTRQMEKTKQMVGEGLAPAEAQAALERQIAVARQQLKMAEAELRLRQSDIALRRREVDARRSTRG